MGKFDGKRVHIVNVAFHRVANEPTELTVLYDDNPPVQQSPVMIPPHLFKGGRG